MLDDSEKEFVFLRQFVQYDKTNPTALMRLARYEAEKHNTKTAFELASEAATVHPERASAHRLDGALYLKSAGDSGRSVQMCEQILDDPSARCRGLLYAGDQLRELQRTDLALRAYRLSVERATQENLKQRASLGVYRIQAEAGGIESIRSDVARLATNGVTPLVRREASEILHGDFKGGS